MAKLVSEKYLHRSTDLENRANKKVDERRSIDSFKLFIIAVSMIWTIAFLNSLGVFQDWPTTLQSILGQLQSLQDLAITKEL